jgi:hypothetical protein
MRLETVAKSFFHLYRKDEIFRVKNLTYHRKLLSFFVKTSMAFLFVKIEIGFFPPNLLCVIATADCNKEPQQLGKINFILQFTLTSTDE